MSISPDGNTTVVPPHPPVLTDTTTQSRRAPSTAPLIPLISLAVLSLSSLPLQCVSLCESVFRVMAPNDRADTGSEERDSNNLSFSFSLFPVTVRVMGLFPLD